MFVRKEKVFIWFIIENVVGFKKLFIILSLENKNYTHKCHHSPGLMKC